MIKRDTARYSHLLKGVARLSGLFSSNDAPYVDSRFVEKLFVETAGARDLSRRDASFDALMPDGVGVGIKTFLGGAGNSKKEKVAEFTEISGAGLLNGLSKADLVATISTARNERILSDAAEYGVDVSRSVYHCLVRFVGGAVVHEEPYELIDVGNLQPSSKTGVPQTSWGAVAEGVHFTDGKSFYTYSTSKSVLMKRFVFDRRKDFIDLEIDPDPLALLDSLVGRVEGVALLDDITSVSSPPPHADEVRGSVFAGATTGTGKLSVAGFGFEADSEKLMVPGVDYVVLPLYSTRDRQVPEKSGINQWNAGGRPRAFGEAYVPIPASIHRQFPDFFPARDSIFMLRLPNSAELHRAKVCQDGSKALMTSPNFELGKWIISVLDPSKVNADFNKPVSGESPYAYADLLRIGKDAVMVTKLTDDQRTIYSLEFAPVGSYEDFVAEA
jgi:hypothetical protein